MSTTNWCKAMTKKDYKHGGQQVIGVEYDVQSMKIDTIRDDDVKFATMFIGYKVYQSNQFNSISSITIHATCQMVKEDVHYNLCSVLLEELLINLKKIKQDKNHVFKYGSFVIQLALHFMNQILEIDRV